MPIRDLFTPAVAVRLAERVPAGAASHGGGAQRHHAVGVRDLRTESGLRYRIYYPGRPNDAATAAGWWSESMGDTLKGHMCVSSHPFNLALAIAIVGKHTVSCPQLVCWHGHIMSRSRASLLRAPVDVCKYWCDSSCLESRVIAHHCFLAWHPPVHLPASGWLCG